MAYNFNTLLTNAGQSYLDDMPPIDIDKRVTDKNVVYNKNKTRLDRIAGDVYQDETLWKVILWANSGYEVEFDIPDDTVIRIPWPKQEVLDEISVKIINNKDLG